MHIEVDVDVRRVLTPVGTVDTPTVVDDVTTRTHVIRTADAAVVGVDVRRVKQKNPIENILYRI